MEEKKHIGRPRNSKDKAKRPGRKDLQGARTWPSVALKDLKPGDNSKYLIHAMETAAQPKIDTNDPEQVSARVTWYFAHCAEDDMKPTVSGLANALGVNRDTLRRWATGQQRADSPHTEIARQAYGVLEELWEDYMVNGKVNPAAGIFLGKNHWGYKDESEVVLTPNNPLGPEPDAARLIAEYEQNLPELEE